MAAVLAVDVAALRLKKRWDPAAAILALHRLGDIRIVAGGADGDGFIRGAIQPMLFLNGIRPAEYGHAIVANIHKTSQNELKNLPRSVYNGFVSNIQPN